MTTRRSNLGARREKQRPLIQPLKAAHTDYRKNADEMEAVIRKEIEIQAARQRGAFMSLVQQTVAATSAVAIAEELGVTRQTVYRWLHELEDTKKVDQ